MLYLSTFFELINYILVAYAFVYYISNKCKF